MVECSLFTEPELKYLLNDFMYVTSSKTSCNKPVIIEITSTKSMLR